MSSLKNVIFVSGMFLFTILLSPMIIWMLPLPGKKHLYAVCRFWIGFFFIWGRWVWGIRFQISGLEHLPKNQPAILASKHQSMWETFIFFVTIPNAVFVLKRELLWIPVWGWWLARIGTIAIDRKSGVKALHKILLQAKKYKAENRMIIIYPEGTRTMPNQRQPLKSGVALIYQALGVPVIPVALNSGYFFPKRGKKSPGLIRIVLHEPIKAGLPKKEMMQRLTDILHSESEALLR